MRFGSEVVVGDAVGDSIVVVGSEFVGSELVWDVGTCVLGADTGLGRVAAGNREDATPAGVFRDEGTASEA